MDLHALVKELHKKNDSKIVLLVADGLGGLPPRPLTPEEQIKRFGAVNAFFPEWNKTELETAQTPNLDALARRGTSGLMTMIKPGITPGSGPGHLAMFGYDPLRYQIGRGALEATGVGFALGPKDVAVRCNFCTLDAQGRITDRRAGRISTEQSAPLAIRLRQIQIPGVEVFVEPVKEHRFVVVFRGEGLGDQVTDTDPQATGVPPLDPVGADPASQRTAEAAKEFIRQARQLLADQPHANGLTMRGFARRPDMPTYEEVYGLRAAAIAVYPMYKGLAQLVGMKVVGSPSNLKEEIDLLEQVWQDFDFFFVHFKYTDSRGEDGDFEAKVRMIEEFDSVIPRVVALNPTVLAVTGDHSTPSRLASHSWHPVPVVIVADSCRPDGCQEFSESAACRGGLGHFEAMYLMPLLLAHAGRLEKFGA